MRGAGAEMDGEGGPAGICQQGHGEARPRGRGAAFEGLLMCGGAVQVATGQSLCRPVRSPGGALLMETWIFMRHSPAAAQLLVSIRVPRVAAATPASCPS